jgi:hypothetical protein
LAVFGVIIPFSPFFAPRVTDLKADHKKYLNKARCGNADKSVFFCRLK